MKLSTLQGALQHWLEQRLPPLTYETYEPDSGEVRILVPPPTKLDYDRQEGAVIGNLYQDLFLQVRLEAEDHEDLDHAKIGAIYQGVAMELALRGQRFGDELEELSMRPVESPIMIAPTEDQKGGTMVTFRWSMFIRFYADPESPFGVELGGPFGPGDRGLYTAEDVRFSILKSPLESERLTDNAIVDYDS